MASNDLNTRIKLSEVCDVIASPVDKKSKDGEIAVRLCNYTDVYYNTVISNDMPFMAATATRDEIKKFSLQPGDVVITKDSESPDDIAIPALVGCDVKDLVCGYHLIILRPKNGFSGAYLHYLLCTQKVRYQFFKVASGITRFGLPVGAVGDVLLKFPNAEKQREIAATLSTWDRAIELHDRLIALKEKQKQGLMQQLLTGKKRLLDDNGVPFSGEWASENLSSLCTIKTGKKDVNEGCENGAYPFFTCANEPTYSNSFSYDCEALLIAGNGSVGRTHYYNGKFEAYQRTYILSNFNGAINTKFLHQYILFWLGFEVEKGKQHGAMPYIKIGLLQAFNVFIPRASEQSKIASVLLSADNEINALKRKRDLLMQQKQGLMQQLLG